MSIYSGAERDRQTDRQTYIERDREKEGEGEKETDIQRQRQREEETDRQTDRGTLFLSPNTSAKPSLALAVNSTQTTNHIDVGLSRTNLIDRRRLPD